MRKLLFFYLIAILFVLPVSVLAEKKGFIEIKQMQSPQTPKLGFMIHGGAGVIRRRDLSAEKEKQYRAELEKTLMTGYKALQDGKSSLDAVETAIKMLEDSPLLTPEKARFLLRTGKTSLTPRL